jgi:hypothetical protein
MSAKLCATGGQAMTVQEFVCYRCDIWWHDKYSFWRGYQSSCPRCGKSCRAIRDTLEYADQREMEYTGFDIGGPLFEDEESGAEKTEADLEAERGQIHEEIAEALESVGAETSDIDADVEGAGADDGGESAAGNSS